MTIALAQQLGYLDFVKQRGVPEAKAMACLNDQKNYAQVAAMSSAAQSQYNVNSTPTFVLNGTVVDIPLGVEPWDAVQKALKAGGA